MSVETQLAVELVASDRWHTLLDEFVDVTYRQLAAYSDDVALRVGARSELVAIRSEGELLGVCNVRIRKLPLLPFGIAYVNGAPLVMRTGGRVSPDVALRKCLIALRNEFVVKRGNVLRVIGNARTDLVGETACRPFLDAGFVQTKEKGGYRTILVDIGRELADIRRGFDQKWRNVLNKSERQGLKIVSGSESGLFEEFFELYRGLINRKNLTVDLGPDFFLALQERLPEADRFIVHLAMLDGAVVAGHIGAYHGDTAIYLLGAANEVGLKANASYLLQWCVIKYAKERGCHWYDLGGIDPQSNPDVYRFKARIGGMDVSAPGPYETGSYFRRVIISAAEAVYRQINNSR